MKAFLNIDENKIGEIMQAATIPGVAIAFVDNEGNISTKEMGVTYHGSNTRITPETTFGVASLSKVVFAFMVLKLVEKGKISLDTKLNNILSLETFCKQNNFPYVKEWGDERRAQSLTIGMVLSHTTGLPNDTPVKFEFEPGKEYGYSGIGMMYLQKVLEIDLKQDLETLMQEHVFKELKMHHSTFQKNYTISLLEDKNRTYNTFYIFSSPTGLIYEVIGLDNKLKKGFLPWTQFPAKFPHDVDQIINEKEKYIEPILELTDKKGHTITAIRSANAANSLHTTPNDYAKFIYAWLQDEKMLYAFKSQINMTNDTWAKEMGVPGKDLKNVAWGLGVGLQKDSKGKVISIYHSGDMNEWRAWVGGNIEDEKNKTAIVYFTNSKNGHVLAKPILSHHVKLEQVLTYFSEKYGFAIDYEDGWQDKENKRFKKIGPYLRTRGISVAENQKILSIFWQKRVLDENQDSIVALRGMIERVYPKSLTLFNQAIAGKNINLFLELANPNNPSYLNEEAIHAIDQFEKLGVSSAEATSKFILKISQDDLNDLEDYIQVKEIDKKATSTAIITGNSENIIKPYYENEQSESVFAMHSVGKVFTGVLVLLMLRKGIITEDHLNKDVYSLLGAVKESLPPDVKAHLKKVTLYQAMTHCAGLGNQESNADYLQRYTQSIAESLGNNKVPQPINTIEAFLPFAFPENEAFKPSNIGKKEYSNTGILLVGLVIKNLYQAFSKNNHLLKIKGEDDLYQAILQHFILKPANITSFSTTMPKNGKFNQKELSLAYIQGSPAGGYWITASDLARFGSWVYLQCKNDPELRTLLEKYGEEFYTNGLINHKGDVEKGSAYLSVSLNNGHTVAVLNAERDNAANQIGYAIRKNLIIKPIKETLAKMQMKALSALKLYSMLAKLSKLYKNNKVDVIQQPKNEIKHEITEISELDKPFQTGYVPKQ